MSLRKNLFVVSLCCAGLAAPALGQSRSDLEPPLRAPSPLTPALAPPPPATPVPLKVAETSAVMRDLWIGHIFWTRNVVVATLDGNKAAAAAAEKEVVANARAISDAIAPYYGTAGADKLNGLLDGHYGAVKQYLEATVASSRAKQEAAYRALTSNATEIARFLSSANPNLPFETLNGMLLTHGGHHVAAITQLNAKQYAEEAKTWDAMRTHIEAIADALAAAIAKQFPMRFS